MTIYQIAERHRAALLASDRAAASRMIEAYGRSWLSIKRGLTTLSTMARKAREALELPEGTMTDRQTLKAQRMLAEILQKDARYRILMADVEAQIRVFASIASQEVLNGQRLAVEAAQANAAVEAAVAAGSPTPGVGLTWNRVPVEAVENLVGYMGDGSPLARTFESFAGEAVQQVKDQLTIGLVKGFNPRKIAQLIRERMGGNLERALLIARTETLRSYRQAAIQSYQANDDVVDRWMWHAHLGPRTCAACIAMHGRTFPITVPFGSHPACRCAPVPITKTWEELGFGPGIAEPAKGPTGEQWLEKQSTSTQQEVLGKKWQAWSDGTISLSDVVGYRNDPDWGPTRWEKSAKALGLDMNGKPIPPPAVPDLPEVVRPVEPAAPQASNPTPPPPEPPKALKVVDVWDEMHRQLPPHARPTDAEGKRDWLLEAGVIASDTKQRVRYAYRLSDGRIVSGDGVVRILHPESYAKLLEIKAAKGAAAGRKALFKALDPETQAQVIDLIDTEQIARAMTKTSQPADMVAKWMRENGHMLNGVFVPELEPVYNEVWAMHELLVREAMPIEKRIEFLNAPGQNRVKWFNEEGGWVPVNVKVHGKAAAKLGYTAKHAT